MHTVLSVSTSLGGGGGLARAHVHMRPTTSAAAFQVFRILPCVFEKAVSIVLERSLDDLDGAVCRLLEQLQPSNRDVTKEKSGSKSLLTQFRSNWAAFSYRSLSYFSCFNNLVS